MGARYYSPALGSFSQLDPVRGSAEDPASLNRYAYAEANPATLIDPDGHAVACTAEADFCTGPGGTLMVNPRSAADPTYAAAKSQPTVSQRDDWAADMAAGTWTSPAQVQAFVAALPQPKRDCGFLGIGCADLGGVAHLALGVASIVPVVGSVAAGADALLYLAQGDYGGAAMAAIGIVPVMGAAAKGLELLGKATGLVHKATEGLEAVKTAVTAERGLSDVAKVGEDVGTVAKESAKALEAGDAGAFSELQARGVVGDELTPHHMPQAAARYTSYGEGGALAMRQSEHALTRTYGFRGARTLTSDSTSSFRQVLARDIWDVRSIVGPRYDQGLRDLIDYYGTNFPELMTKGGGW